MAFQEEVLGLKDLEDALRKAADVVAGDEMAEALTDGVWVMAFEAKKNALENGLFISGDLVDSIEPRKVNQYRVDLRVGVIYGAVHEYGLDDQPITAKQRGFFWAKWYETSDPMWKALALSVTYTIPARPYLRPAVDTKKREAVQVAARSLGDRIRGALR